MEWGSRRPCGLGRTLGSLALLGLWSFAAAAGDEGLPMRVDPARREGWIVCEIQLGPLLTPPVESTLKSGLPVVVDLACELRPTGEEPRFAQLVRSELSYDVWEDRYSLLRGSRSEEFDELDSLMAACRHFSSLALGPERQLDPAGSFDLRIRVAVNPLSGPEREKMARWLAETVTDAGDPASRELRLDLGGLIQSFFQGGDASRRGSEGRFGPFAIADLPVLPPEERPEGGAKSATEAGGESPGDEPKSDGDGEGSP